MPDRSKLYRLLQDDENPLDEGISARRPLANDSALIHIRHGSRRSSQWISTSRELSAIDKFIKLKRKKEGVFAKCRVVEIDEEKLQEYSEQCSNVSQELLSELQTLGDGKSEHFKCLFNHVRDQPTGRILDFTDQTVMEMYIPFNPAKPKQNERARCFARKYREVLVEGHIPAECCIAIYDR